MSTTTADLPAGLRPRPGPGVATSAALSGAVAAGLALGASELLAAILPGAASLIASVGQVVIDLQPPGAKDLVVALFGTNDKLALELFVSGSGVGFGALLGLVARSRFALASAGFGAFGLLGVAASLGDPVASPAMTAISAGLAVLLGVRTLGWLLKAPSHEAIQAVAEMPDWSRRVLLRRVAIGGAGAVAMGVVGHLLIRGQRTAPVGSNGDLLTAAEPAFSLAPGTDLAPAVPRLSPIVTPNSGFYLIDTALLTPAVDTATWTLRIHGLVERETTLTWDELTSLPLFEQYVTIACVSNEVGGDLVGNAKWTGVRLREVLDIAGVQPAATQLVGRSVDGWTAGMPTAWVMDPSREPMIAIGMNDEPLPVPHGYPARLIVPGLYGYVSATKWLAELMLTTMEGFDGYWVPLGWAKEAPILTQSRIDTPRGGTVPSGRVPVAGVAWAPDRGISRVEVAIDGTWHDARLSAPISDSTWVQWVYDWQATPGRHQIQVRATDGTGVTQEELRSPPAPDGARGWHSAQVEVA